MKVDTLSTHFASILASELTNLTGARWSVVPAHSGPSAWFECRAGGMVRYSETFPYHEFLFTPINDWLKGQARMICLNL